MCISTRRSSSSSLLPLDAPLKEQTVDSSRIPEEVVRGGEWAWPGRDVAGDLLCQPNLPTKIKPSSCSDQQWPGVNGVRPRPLTPVLAGQKSLRAPEWK